MNGTRRLTWLVWACAALAALLGVVLIVGGLRKNWLDLTIDLVRGGIVLALGAVMAKLGLVLSRGAGPGGPGRGPEEDGHAGREQPGT